MRSVNDFNAGPSQASSRLAALCAEVAAWRDDVPVGRSASELRDDVARYQERLAPLRDRLRPRDSVEPLDLVDARGRDLGVRAPRWLCHLVGLPHRVVHLALTWRNHAGEELAVIQLRGWDVSAFPGHLDIAVAGHVKAGQDAQRTVAAELGEELGLHLADLESPPRHHGGAFHVGSDADAHLLDAQWREVYSAALRRDRADRLRVRGTDPAEQELAGLLLCPVSDLPRLLDEGRLPVAPALRLYVTKRP